MVLRRAREKMAHPRELGKRRNLYLRGRADCYSHGSPHRLADWRMGASTILKTRDYLLVIVLVCLVVLMFYVLLSS